MYKTDACIFKQGSTETKVKKSATPTEHKLFDLFSVYHHFHSDSLQTVLYNYPKITFGNNTI